MRAGLFGGTFNPIHNGHMMVARRVLQRFALDRLFIVPCRQPPHKRPAFLADGPVRVRMIELALPADERLVLSDIELLRRGPSYTIDTVVQFRTRILPDADLFLVMGLDAFLEIHTWRDFRHLFDIIQPVVVFRSPGEDARQTPTADLMDGYIQTHLPAGYRFDRQRCFWAHASARRIHLIETPPVDVSSSLIRSRIREGRSVADLVPPAVNAYIEQKELYR